jgi:hypothetical protein
MKKRLTVPVLALALSVPFSLLAEEEKQDTYIYATYFYCNTSTQEKADEAVEKTSAPVYDAAVADGTIKSWGWLAHHTGGKWRRIQYHSSDSVEGLLASQVTIGNRIDEASGGADGISEVCPSRDDYIWKVENGNGPGQARGSAGLSVYMVCDMNREDRADEIVDKVFGPVYNKAVADGKITSWGWNSHIIGGKYRRLATMTGNDFAGLMKARGEILQTIYGDGENAEAKEFNDICGSHSDYLWEVVHEKP